MSKALTRLSLALLAASLCAAATAAQTLPAQTPTPTPKPEWVIGSPAETLEWPVLSPAGEEFTARMPNQHALAEQRQRVGEMYVTGARYAASEDDGTATYVVWSLQSPDGALWRSMEAADKSSGAMRYGLTTTSFATLLYLDHVAELAWEMLVTPELERIKREESWWRRQGAKARVGMTYVRSFTIGEKHAREYFLSLQKGGGHVYVCADTVRIYVVAAHGASADDARLRQFVDSFAFKGAAPAPTPTPRVGTSAKGGLNIGGGGGYGGGFGPAPVDYNRPFRQSEVTQKARLTRKPEPGFTEQARKFEVVGKVRLRAILSKTGEVTSIAVVKYLPHGLTEKSIAAARLIRFEPAQKDGRAVSQYILLDYNYNIY